MGAAVRVAERNPGRDAEERVIPVDERRGKAPVRRRINPMFVKLLLLLIIWRLVRKNQSEGL